MNLRGKNILITGGAGGIGAAMASRFVAEGAAGIGIADLDGDAAASFAATLSRGDRSGLNTWAYQVDVGDADRLQTMVEEFERDVGPIDLMCSNAGVYQTAGSKASDLNWEINWTINVMSHVRVARAVLPRLLRRRTGYLLMTCSGAGLLANMDAPYMVTKHAAVAFAEWLAIQYRLEGIGVSALCPLGVRTPMVSRAMQQDAAAVAGVIAGGDLIEPEQVADCVVEGLAAEEFLILPHAQVRERLMLKARDRDSWIRSMQWQYGIEARH